MTKIDNSGIIITCDLVLRNYAVYAVGELFYASGDAKFRNDVEIIIAAGRNHSQNRRPPCAVKRVHRT